MQLLTWKILGLCRCLLRLCGCRHRRGRHSRLCGVLLVSARLQGQAAVALRLLSAGGTGRRFARPSSACLDLWRRHAACTGCSKELHKLRGCGVLIAVMHENSGRTGARGGGVALSIV